MLWVLVAVAAVALSAIGVLVVKQRRALRRPDGMQSFRRHMDALSSDARQNVIGRVRDAEQRKGGRHGS
jgi:hypothetical protein